MAGEGGQIIMETLILTLAIFAALLVILMMGLPVSFAMGFSGIVGILIFADPRILPQIGTVAYNQATSMTVLMIPMFILMAEFLANSNFAADIFDALDRRLRKVPANLAIVSVVASTIFSSICSSAPATAATIGRISIPAMLKAGYDQRFAAGTQSAAGNIGILLPPSITLIVYGMITETSIVRLFMAAIIPGFIITIMMIIYILIRNKVGTPIIRPTEESKQISNETEKISLLRDAMTVLPIVILVIIILTLLYTGIATATESAAIGAFAASVIVFLKGRMTKDCIKKTLFNTTSTSCMILFMMVGGLIFALFLTIIGLPQTLAAFLIEVVPSPWFMFVILNIIFIFLGLFLDNMSAMMMTLPFLFPVMMEMGFDPVWLGVIIVVNLCIGMITPPVGTNIFVIVTVSGIPFTDVWRGALPYCFVLLLGIIMLSFFPDIALFLPSTM
jgi:C4-dicarboxylate transporter DctM subunit